MQRADGFSLVEVLVASVLVLAAVSVVLTLTGQARDFLTVQPEAADLQQRLRVAADALYKDLVMAGAGAYQGAAAGSLLQHFAPILPARPFRNADPAGTASNDRIAIAYVPTTAAQTSLAATGPVVPSGDVVVNNDSGCPAVAAACGFQTGMTALVFDETGLRDFFNVAAVTGSTLNVQSNSSALTFAGYPSGTTRIVEAITVVYSLKFDAAARAYQLVRSDGHGPDAPVVDHVVGLAFDYYGDPQPPRLTGKPLDDPVGPWTTYGPPPPPLTIQGRTAGYPAGESCLFVVDSTSTTQLPRLPALSPETDSGLSTLTINQLTDGPWCPDSTNPNRWDADLLRIRSVKVTIRLQSANAALRGPAGVLFANGGSSTSVRRWVPDLQASFRVTPRNLNLER